MLSTSARGHSRRHFPLSFELEWPLSNNLGSFIWLLRIALVGSKRSCIFACIAVFCALHDGHYNKGSTSAHKGKYGKEHEIGYIHCKLFQLYM